MSDLNLDKQTHKPLSHYFFISNKRIQALSDFWSVDLTILDFTVNNLKPWLSQIAPVSSAAYQCLRKIREFKIYFSHDQLL